MHIGSPKAGSSFLQTICANSRTALKEKGIHYPFGTAHDERCMLSGRISAGNTRSLSKAISANRQGWQEQWISRVIAEARDNGCSRVLVSSEWLLDAFAEPNKLVDFVRYLSAQGVTSTSVLLILRDPITQLVSLYKHRAKKGTVGNIGEWSRWGYHLPSQLAGLRAQSGPSGVDLVVRGYSREPGRLEEVFFSDWLDSDIPKPAAPPVVNPSLSLSELVLVRELATRDPFLASALYQRLAAVPQERKTESTQMREYAEQVAKATVSAHSEEWNHWNKFLPTPEQFELPGPNEAPANEPSTLQLSTDQHAALMQLLTDAIRPRFLARRLWQANLRPLLSRMKHFVIPRDPLSS